MKLKKFFVTAWIVLLATPLLSINMMSSASHLSLKGAPIKEINTIQQKKN